MSKLTDAINELNKTFQTLQIFHKIAHWTSPFSRTYGIFTYHNQHNIHRRSKLFSITDFSPLFCLNSLLFFLFYKIRVNDKVFSLHHPARFWFHFVLVGSSERDPAIAANTNQTCCAFGGVLHRQIISKTLLVKTHNSGGIPATAQNILPVQNKRIGLFVLVGRLKEKPLRLQQMHTTAAEDVEIKIL